MKFGEQLEWESVPEWSLHNVDYNSLKHEIKVHTSRDQATTIAIPGQEDTRLRKFEDGLFLELCRQHERVDLFVKSKADEVARRLEHLAPRIEQFVRRCGREATSSSKTRRRFVRLERELLRCGDDLAALRRFIAAQVKAFRKIIKKYRKWTGSATLGSRFRTDVLSDPKGFSKKDFSITQARYDELKATLRAAAPESSEPSSPDSDECPHEAEPNGEQIFTPLPPPTQQGGYWNEYDYGSDGVAGDDGYAIYINPDDGDDGFPGFEYARALVSSPFIKAKSWFSRPSPERAPLLAQTNSFRRPRRQASYRSTTGVASSNSDEEFSSGDDFPPGYAPRYAALPSINEQSVARYRESVYFFGTVGSFVGSFVLIIVAGILLSTGRHKARLEVDAGAMVGIAASLMSSFAGLGMFLLRRDMLSIWHKAAVWTVFFTTCFLNVILLILVMNK